MTKDKIALHVMVISNVRAAILCEFEKKNQGWEEEEFEWTAGELKRKKLKCKRKKETRVHSKG